MSIPFVHTNTSEYFTNTIVEELLKSGNPLVSHFVTYKYYSIFMYIDFGLSKRTRMKDTIFRPFR